MISENQLVFLFYAVIILLIFFNRKKFDMHGILALYRTNFGLKSMDSMANKYREIIKLIAYIGIGAGYIGLFAISYILLKNFIDLLIVPTAQSAVSPVIPGVKIGGYKIPLVSGWIALFFVILIHEFSHGVVARAHNMKVKSSGLFFLGPLMGAFVEPDENQLKKSSDVTQYSILAAGPFSNMLLSGVIILLFLFIIPPIHNTLIHEKGFELQEVQDNYPAKSAGLKEGMVITKVNDEFITTHQSFVNSLKTIKPGEQLTIVANNKIFTLAAATHPENKNSPYLGVVGSTYQVPTNNIAKLIFPVYSWILNFLSLLGALSLGIGLINLFPIFITDGARMLQVSLLKINKNNGIKIWKHTNILCLIILFLSLFFPLFRWLFGVL